MEQQEIDDFAQREPVVEIAERAAQDQCQRRAVPRAAAASQQDEEHGGRDHGDRHEEPALPAGRGGEEAERGAGVERQHEAEKRRDRKAVAFADRCEYRGLRRLIGGDYDRTDPQPAGPARRAGSIGVALHGCAAHANARGSPDPNRFDTQRPQSAGCPGSLPTSAR